MRKALWFLGIDVHAKAITLALALADGVRAGAAAGVVADRMHRRCAVAHRGARLSSLGFGVFLLGLATSRLGFGVSGGGFGVSDPGALSLLALGALGALGLFGRRWSA